MDKIRFREVSVAASSAPARAVPGARRKLTAQSSSDSSSVVICSYNCNCPDCRVAIAIDDSGSETSMVASNNTDFVPSARGGQKRKVEELEELKDLEKPPQVADTTGKKSKKVTKKPAKKMTTLDQPSKLTLVPRHKPEHKRSGYILVDGKYLVGLSKKKSENYLKVLEKLMEELQAGELRADKDAAKHRMRELMSDMADPSSIVE